jgi:hypothetical protein
MTDEKSGDLSRYALAVAGWRARREELGVSVGRTWLQLIARWLRKAR